MTDKEYNGWSNYNSWTVALHIGNEKTSYDYWREKAQEAYNEAKRNEVEDKDAQRDDAEIKLAEELKEEFEEGASDVLEAAKAETSVYADLLYSALSDVNWYEVAKAQLEGVWYNEKRERG